MLYIVLGLIIGASVGVVAYQYNAKDVAYTPSDNTWDVTNVESAIESLKANEEAFQSKNMVLIGKNQGASISIPNGYRYVIISNSYYGGPGKAETYRNMVNLVSNTNSTVVFFDNHAAQYNVASSANSILISKIDDPTKTAVFNYNGSDYNIVYGVK